MLNEAYITYSNQAKEKLLGVSHETLEKYGAVSAQTAKEMAEGAAKAAGANMGLSTTGIAGPGGGTRRKTGRPGLCGMQSVNQKTETIECRFSGGSTGKSKTGGRKGSLTCD